MTEREIWKPLLGYEGIYSTSNLGRLRIETGSNSTPAGTITIGSKSTRYRKVSLRKNGIRISKDIHVLIAETFISPRPTGMYVNHIDGNKQNNCVSNLEWVTPKQNSRQSVLAGRHHKGSQIFGARLKEQDIQLILSLLSNGISCAEIGRRYHVSRQVISHVKNNRSWKHIALENNLMKIGE